MQLSTCFPGYYKESKTQAHEALMPKVARNPCSLPRLSDGLAPPRIIVLQLAAGLRSTVAAMQCYRDPRSATGRFLHLPSLTGAVHERQMRERGRCWWRFLWWMQGAFA